MAHRARRPVEKRKLRLTTTASALGPMSSRKSRTNVRPTSNVSASMTSDLKPSAAAMTVYEPAGMAGT